MEIRGHKFEESEAREASDFDEIVSNFDLDPELMFQMFQHEGLSVPKRLVIAERATIDDAAMMILGEQDARIRGIIQDRIKRERLNATGGIIC